MTAREILVKARLLQEQLNKVVIEDSEQYPQLVANTRKSTEVRMNVYRMEAQALGLRLIFSNCDLDGEWVLAL